RATRSADRRSGDGRARGRNHSGDRRRRSRGTRTGERSVCFSSGMSGVWRAGDATRRRGGVALCECALLGAGETSGIAFRVGAGGGHTRFGRGDDRRVGGTRKGARRGGYLSADARRLADGAAIWRGGGGRAASFDRGGPANGVVAGDSRAWHSR